MELVEPTEIEEMRKAVDEAALSSWVSLGGVGHSPLGLISRIVSARQMDENILAEQQREMEEIDLISGV